MTSLAKNTLLLNFVGDEGIEEWRQFFLPHFPDLHIAAWNDRSVDPASVHYACVWKPERGRLASFPALRVILSEGAGVDHILSDATLPRHIPVTRMVTTETAARMADYVVMASYMLVRQIPAIVQAQRQQRWDNSLTGRLVSETTIGILGVGQLGSQAAQRLLLNGFRVNGWSRSGKTLPGMTCYSGDSGLQAMLVQSDIIVNLLPDTAETRGIINDDFLAQLPKGAGIINVGRGHQLQSEALLRALHRNHLSGAVLDVFPSEPLPADNPLWRHPGIIITGHVASLISTHAKAHHAIAVIKADRSGQPLPMLYNRESGY